MMKTSPSRRFQPKTGQSLVWLCCCLLAACTTGPDFKSPAAGSYTSHPDAAAYTEHSLPAQTTASQGTDGASQHFQVGQKISAQWWTLFQSPELDQLVKKALERNPNLAATKKTLQQAKDLYTALYGSLKSPNVSLAAQFGREQTSYIQTLNPSIDTNLYNAGVNVSYTVDLFGANKRALEAQQAQIDWQTYQLESAYLALSANVVTAAIHEATWREQIKQTQDLIASQNQVLQLLQAQLASGAVSMAPVLSQQSLIANTQAQLPGLQKSLSQARNQLAVYIGELPSEAQLPKFELGQLTLPIDLPLSVSSDLLRQRPDIQASEALWRQANAQVGVATASLYPQLTLSAQVASLGVNPNEIFQQKFSMWSLFAGVSAPVFNGGALEARKQAAIKAYEAAGDQYRGTVLNAFQNVADSLTALHEDANTLKAQTQAQQLAFEQLKLTRAQYELGGVSYLNLLNAQLNYQQATLAVVSARASRYVDTAALFQALGGGWWNRG